MTVDDFKAVLGEMFTTIEEKRLATVHPDLVRVVRRARELGAKFRVEQGVRSLGEQRKYLADGTSRTLRSRHLPSRDGLSRAVDLVPMVDGKPVIRSWAPYYKLAKIMKQAAKDVGVVVEWGGDWRTFKDGPHWQLPWRLYP